MEHGIITKSWMESNLCGVHDLPSEGSMEESLSLEYSVYLKCGEASFVEIFVVGFISKPTEVCIG